MDTNSIYEKLKKYAYNALNPEVKTFLRGRGKYSYGTIDTSVFATNARVDRLEEDINSKIDDVNTRVDETNAKIDTVEQELTTKIDTVELELTTKIDDLEEDINAKLDLKADKVDLDNYYTKEQSDEKFQPVGDYATNSRVNELEEDLNARIDTKADNTRVDALEEDLNDKITNLEETKLDNLIAAEGIVITNDNVIYANIDAEGTDPLVLKCENDYGKLIIKGNVDSLVTKVDGIEKDVALNSADIVTNLENIAENAEGIKHLNTVITNIETALYNYKCFIPVKLLPTEDIDTHAIYLVPAELVDSYDIALSLMNVNTTTEGFSWDPTTGILTTNEYGSIGILYDSPLDLSGYLYLKVILGNATVASDSSSVLLYDENNRFGGDNTCLKTSLTNGAGTYVIDLHGVAADGATAFNPSSIYFLLFLTAGGTEHQVLVVGIYATNYVDNNQFIEYIYVNGTWEELGRAAVDVDLSDYYTLEETNALLDTKQDTLTAGDNVTIENNTVSVDLSNYYTHEEVILHTITDIKTTSVEPLSLSGSITEEISLDHDGHTEVTKRIFTLHGEVDTYSKQEIEDKLASLNAGITSVVALGTVPLNLYASIVDGELSIYGTIDEATTTSAGIMSAEDKRRLDALYDAWVNCTLGDCGELETTTYGTPTVTIAYDQPFPAEGGTFYPTTASYSLEVITKTEAGTVASMQGGTLDNTHGARFNLYQEFDNGEVRVLGTNGALTVDANTSTQGKTLDYVVRCSVISNGITGSATTGSLVQEAATPTHTYDMLISNLTINSGNNLSADGGVYIADLSVNLIVDGVASALSSDLYGTVYFTEYGDITDDGELTIPANDSTSNKTFIIGVTVTWVDPDGGLHDDTMNINVTLAGKEDTGGGGDTGDTYGLKFGETEVIWKKGSTSPVENIGKIDFESFYASSGYYNTTEKFIEHVVSWSNDHYDALLYNETSYIPCGTSGTLEWNKNLVLADMGFSFVTEDATLRDTGCSIVANVDYVTVNLDTNIESVIYSITNYTVDHSLSSDGTLWVLDAYDVSTVNLAILDNTRNFLRITLTVN